MADNGGFTTIRMVRNIKNDGTEPATGDVATVQSDGTIDWETPAASAAAQSIAQVEDELVEDRVQKSLQGIAFDSDVDIEVIDGIIHLVVPSFLDGRTLIKANAKIIGTAGTTSGTTEVMIHNKDTGLDVLSVAISIATTALLGTEGKIIKARSKVSAYDVLRIDIDAITAVAAKGLSVILEFK